MPATVVGASHSRRGRAVALSSAEAEDTVFVEGCSEAIYPRDKHNLAFMREGRVAILARADNAAARAITVSN